MIWHCEHCEYCASVGLVSDIRLGATADCPACHRQMVAESLRSEPTTTASSQDIRERQLVEIG